MASEDKNNYYHDAYGFSENNQDLHSNAFKNNDQTTHLFKVCILKHITIGDLYQYITIKDKYTHLFYFILKEMIGNVPYDQLQDTQ